MNTVLRTTLVFFLILCSCAQALYGQEEETFSTKDFPALEPSVEISNLQVIGDASTGSVFTLQVDYTPRVSGRGEISIQLPENIKRSQGVNREQRRISVGTDFQRESQFSRSFELQAIDEGASIIHASVSMPTAPDGYKKHITRHIYIETKGSSATVVDPRTEDAQLPNSISEVPNHRQIQKDDIGQSIDLSGSPRSYSINIDGLARFYESNLAQFIGVPGIRVELFFRDSDAPLDWYHPVNGYSRHTHFDEVDEAGDYSFNFSFQEYPELLPYDEIVIAVGNANEATTLQTNSIQFFTIPFDPNNSGVTATKNLEVDPHRGRMLRYMMLSREFIEQRYNGNVPFSIGRVNSEFTYDSDTCGSLRTSWNLFSWNARIRINPEECSEFTTISHEYGHWINWRMWKGSERSFQSTSSLFKEGWAIFFSFAVRNYANNQYGDPIRIGDDNTETHYRTL